MLGHNNNSIRNIKSQTFASGGPPGDPPLRGGGLVRLRFVCGGVGGWVAGGVAGVGGVRRGPLVVGYHKGYRSPAAGASGGGSRWLKQDLAFATCACGGRPIVLRIARRREDPT
jgi:hypothetical protein